MLTMSEYFDWNTGRLGATLF